VTPGRRASWTDRKPCPARRDVAAAGRLGDMEMYGDGGISPYLGNIPTSPFRHSVCICSASQAIMAFGKLEETNMGELIFLVEESPEGGFTARGLGEAIFTEADSLEELHASVRDAVRCHFDKGKAPNIVRLHFVREEVMPV